MIKSIPYDSNKFTIRSLFKKCKYGLLPSSTLSNHLRGHSTFVKRLQLTDILKSHVGCVNTIEWNSEGSLLLSGSDDRHLVIWNLSGKELSRFRTNHDGNIFAAKFLNECNDSKIVSGAADGTVILHAWRGTETGAVQTLRGWKNQSRRVKQVIVSQENPFLFYSCSENGLLIEYDERRDENSIIQVEKHEIKSIAINPVKPYLIASAVSEDCVKLFDLRNTIKPIMTFASAIVTTRKSGQTATYIEFNSSGTKLLANCQGEGTYIFDAILGDDREPRFIERMDKLLKATLSKEDMDPESFVPEYSPYERDKSEAHEYFLIDNQIRAIEVYSKVILQVERDFRIDSTNIHLKAELALLYQLRGDCYCKRNYKCDAMDAARDYIRSMDLFPKNSKAHIGICEALENMDQYAKAKKWSNTFIERFNFDVETIMKHPEKKNTTRWNYLKMEGVRDYERRYVGIVNQRTDIKQARFFGGNDQFIIAGSDCGHMFIWETETGNIVRLLKADNKILNCTVPHPSAPLIASSGIENVIKLWAPFEGNNGNLPEDIDIWKNRDDTSHFDEIIMENQQESNQVYLSNVEIFLRLAQLRNNQPEAFEGCRQQ